ncbi:MAG: sulfatase-like hydrolase/transferase [Persicimonas sp.]
MAAIPRTGPGVSTGLSREATLHITLSALGDESLHTEAAPDGRLYDTKEAALKSSASIEETPRNLVFIVLESTRASSTTLHNPSLETTPYLRELGSSSLVMDQAYAVLPHTSKALVAILCGIPPMPTMSNVEADPGIIPGRCLPELLDDHDYRSLFMQSATADFEDRTALVDQMGYDDFYPLEALDTEGFEKANYFGYEEDIMLSRSDKWLAEHGDEPFFATYLTLSPHHNYLAPRRYGRYDFAQDDMFNRYLNAVHYLDHFVQNILEQYRDRGLYDSTLFVIVGDHGEAFGEHGRYQHDNVIYQEGIHVPWMIHSEQTEDKPERIDEPVSHLDILPTSVEMLGYEVEGGTYPGASVFEAPSDRPLYFSCWYEDRCIGLLREDEKFIYHYDERSPQLYDLSEDPAEQTNVIDDYDDEHIAELRRAVLTWKQLAAKPYLED